VKLASGDYDRARELTLEALAICQRDGQAEGEAIALCNLGGIELAAGNYTQSIERYSDAVELALRLNYVGLLGDSFLHLAEIAASGSAPAEALAVLASGEERLERAGHALDPWDARSYEATRELLERKLDEPARAAARAAGTGLADQDAAVRALAAARAAVEGATSAGREAGMT
jgi:tetratricopeptide (TPR) repeat protein